MDEKDVELAVRERAGVEDVVAVVIDERDRFQRRRHGGQETGHDLFADIAAGFAVDERFTLGAHVGDLLQHTLRAEQGGWDFALGFHEGETEIAAIVGILFGDRHIEQMATADPALLGLRAEVFQGRRDMVVETRDGVFRQPFDDVKQACGNGTAFK